MTQQTTAWKYDSNKDANAGRNNNQGKNRAGNNNKDKEMLFATQDQMSSGYYGTYNTVKEIIMNKVQKKYEYGCDMAQGIRAGKAFDIDTVKPVRGQSTKTDPEARRHEQGGMDIMYQEELRVYLDRKKAPKR